MTVGELRLTYLLHEALTLHKRTKQPVILHTVEQHILNSLTSGKIKYPLNLRHTDLHTLSRSINHVLSEEEINFLISFLEQNRKDVYAVTSLRESFLISDRILQRFIGDIREERNTTLGKFIESLLGPVTPLLWADKELRLQLYDDLVEMSYQWDIGIKPRHIGMPPSISQTKECLEYIFNQGLVPFNFFLPTVNPFSNPDLFAKYVIEAKKLYEHASEERMQVSQQSLFIGGNYIMKAYYKFQEMGYDEDTITR
jgi:hypothetical protein